jgi:F0F1-type ATP synthase assembly protein I
VASARRVIKIIIGLVLIVLAIQMGRSQENRSSAYLVGLAGVLTLLVNIAFLVFDKRKP